MYLNEIKVCTNVLYIYIHIYVRFNIDIYIYMNLFIYLYIYIQGVALRIDPKFDCWVYFAFQKYSVFAGFKRKKTQK